MSLIKQYPSEYKSWIAMRARCKPNAKCAKYYYDRRIVIAREWDSFSIFLKDMGQKPAPDYTLERIDNNKGYNRDNCKWATKSEQGKNKASRNSLERLLERKRLLGLNWTQFGALIDKEADENRKKK